MPQISEDQLRQMIDVVLSFPGQMADHAEAEMRRYDDVLARLKQTDDRIGSIDARLNTLNLRECPCAEVVDMQGAFLRDQDNPGRKDYFGHFVDHRDRRTSSEELRKGMRNLMWTVLGVAVVAMGSWIFFALKGAMVDDVQQQMQQQRNQQNQIQQIQREQQRAPQ